MEITKEYKWIDSWKDQITKTDIGKVVSELDDIKSTHGKLNPSLIVEKARDKKSVLHSFFDWDDKSAADSYRRQEASILLRHIQVKVIRDDKPYFVRAFEILNTSSDNFLSDVKFIPLDSFTPANIEALRRSYVDDLGRIINKMSAHEEFNRATSYIEWAVKILNQDSEETKSEGIPSLGAAI